MVRPAARREVARYLQQRYEVSERRACRTIAFSRATLRYRSRLDPRTALRIRMRDIAYSRIRYGYRRVRVPAMSTMTSAPRAAASTAAASVVSPRINRSFGFRSSMAERLNSSSL